MHLVRLTEGDYRPYQRLIRSLEHSVNPKNKCIVPKEKVNEIIEANKKSFLPKPVFIKSMNNPDVEAYFLQNDKNENIGIAYMLFKGKQAHIFDFGILSEYKGQGIGTEFFYMVVETSIKPRHCKLITLNSPFHGAQIFWKKMGFEMVINQSYYAGNPLMKKRL